MADPIVAHIEFTDGQKRPVYEGPAGQYVIDDDGDKVHGVWFIPREDCDVPLVVEGRGYRGNAG
jgi:hypothetical protein